MHSFTVRHDEEKSQHMFEGLHAIPLALATHPEPWRTTVERSRLWQNDRTRDLTIVPQVRAFILWAAEHPDQIATEGH